MLRVEVCKNQTDWDDEILDNKGHPLQLWGWGEVKAAHGWRARRLRVYEEDRVIGWAQVLVRPLPWPLASLAYIPRGPIAVIEDRAVVLKELAKYVKKHFKSVALTVEPDWEEFPEDAGFKQSANSILISETLVLDLNKSESDLLSDMSKKTRQYIRKSEKEGLEVRQATSAEDIAACLEIYKDTARRAGFSLHEDKYYQDIHDKLGSNSLVLMAEKGGEVVAFLWFAISAETAFELYGGMSDAGQALRANYMLKWQAIKRTKEWGLSRYDLNGLLNEGVSKFKQGFASHETKLAGSFDKPLTVLYVIWSQGLPIAKGIARKLKNR